jgi:hypothetical protein
MVLVPDCATINDYIRMVSVLIHVLQALIPTQILQDV